ncbi:MAG: aminomethyl-transferring glycine dehydrogenase [Bacteroidota bacterium]|nr:aminomethyl-transferring glycine dehydrogenase [Bacteroidota bacterium]
MRTSSDQFEHRHIGPNALEIEEMLQVIGVDSVDELINQTLPAAIRMQTPMDIPVALGEEEMMLEFSKIASKNKVNKSYIGQGYYNCYTPGVILRNILENPGWYTQYTPYQAEIAQGRLEALINYQTMVTNLTGLDIANASLLDEPTAASEAMIMLYNEREKSQGVKFFIDKNCFAQTIDLMHTRAIPFSIDLEIGDWRSFKPSSDYFGVLIQYPDAQGNVNDYTDFANACHETGTLVAVATDLLALTLIPSPGEWGADIALGNSQRFGVPMGYGGPHAAFFATKEKYKRQMPGRIIGLSIDSHGNNAYRMALQTREQHIRREKATSNICTAQVLLAIMSGMYSVYHGPKGLTAIAETTHTLTNILAAGLQFGGVTLLNKSWFDTLSIDTTGLNVDEIKQSALSQDINFYYTQGQIRISLDETTSLDDVNRLLEIFGILSFDAKVVTSSNDSLMKRESNFLLHPVFNSHQSETQMLRYIKQLESKDLSLTHSMIALGSCTMKLNATTEMRPVTWSQFGGIHPFAPVDQAAGYTQIFEELSAYLKQVTGFHDISLQPNSGAQGEYAGLMVIRAYFQDRNEHYRNIALIPSSAHGTNPASAVMAGMKVVVVKCDESGNIDQHDLKEKALAHKEDLAVLMVTYPSTHGVFEESIIEMCQVIHDNGGQVYMDGANMNAQVGLTSPGLIGADVCHLNLHKTFCIPHGGGGPGMGPIGVAKHLTPFLPSHVEIKTGGSKAITAISGAPFGSSSILLISYAYIRMMGEVGLTNATKIAILNANYIKAKLDKYYQTLYAGKNGRCAHELILDTRVFKAATNIEVEDIAKRLMDYGFHAPTVSFPVAGTLMIEPTESESKDELDKFCDAMIAIRQEILEIEQEVYDREDNVLKNAPHTAFSVTSDVWSHSYGRQKAVFPLPYVNFNKFWPSVGRVNSSYGDRNLFCICPPIEDYQHAE